MPNREDRLKSSYSAERRKVRGLSDSALKKRRAKLQATIDRATRDFVANLEKSVATGAMSPQEAADEFAAFKRQLDDFKVPFGPN
jgi:hypothetical protein